VQSSSKANEAFIPLCIALSVAYGNLRRDGPAAFAELTERLYLVGLALADSVQIFRLQEDAAVRVPKETVEELLGRLVNDQANGGEALCDLGVRRLDLETALDALALASPLE
jgi:hypothetical protein